jgi:epoxyqueuosine reductase
LPKSAEELAQLIKGWASELGFQQAAISQPTLPLAEQQLNDWLDKGYQGEMHYMASHGSKRSRPTVLEPETRSIISLRMDYLPPAAPMAGTLNDPSLGYISRYALGRDYHKTLRQRLKTLVQRIQTLTGPFDHRVFVDSAPVMEKPLAAQAGLGWVGKHSLIINRHAGSWFFLGEIFTSLELPVDEPVKGHCGSCHACMDICPTQAIVAPYVVDARRCISYLTIELKGSIPEPLRPLMGNRIFGCDDCQLVCPWNRFARQTTETDFLPRHGLDARRLLELFAWTEAEFLQFTEGTALRRIGYNQWLRNLAIALGNSLSKGIAAGIPESLAQRLAHPSELVREHCHWALQQAPTGRAP